MKKVGITGGIGSGKSLVSKVFRQLGIPVFSADDTSRWIVDNDETVTSRIKRIFGENSYQDGRLDRKKMAQVVFNNPDKLALLNAIVHPAVRQRFDDWCRSIPEAGYVIKEAAILFESGADKGLDRVITVFAPEPLRISRIMERDGVSREEVISRMRNQMSDDEKVKLADHVIRNDGHQLVIPQILAIHRSLLGE